MSSNIDREGSTPSGGGTIDTHHGVLPAGGPGTIDTAHGLVQPDPAPEYGVAPNSGQLLPGANITGSPVEHTEGTDWQPGTAHHGKP